LKGFVKVKFEDRAKWAEKEMDRIGLPQASHAAKRQLRQDRKLFRAHDELVSNISNRGSSWSANNTWFSLVYALQPARPPLAETITNLVV
jgi:hypothetical protein